MDNEFMKTEDTLGEVWQHVVCMVFQEKENDIEFVSSTTTMFLDAYIFVFFNIRAWFIFKAGGSVGHIVGCVFTPTDQLNEHYQGSL